MTARPGTDGDAAGPRPIGPRHAWRTDLVARTLLAAAPDGRILDAGCGDGTLAVALEHAGRAAYACDIDLARVVAARRRTGANRVAIRWVCADVTALPWAGGAFAGTAAGEVLEHVRDDAAAAGELARVLAPGGVLVATVPAGAGRYGPGDRAAGHVRRYDRRDLTAVIEVSGLVVETMSGWGLPFGRIYDRWVQRPALAAQRTRAGGGIARIGGARIVRALWRALFAVDGRIDARGHGSGWLVVARRGNGRRSPGPGDRSARDPDAGRT